MIAVILLILSMSLSAQNQLPLLHTFQSSEIFIGGSLANPDFNGDGYTDLAMQTSFYQPGALYSAGRVLFYFGGSDFDYTPDCTIYGDHPGHIGHLYNAGDMNGDGCEDLIILGYAPNLDTLSMEQTFDDQLSVWLGSPDAGVINYAPTLAYYKYFRLPRYDGVCPTPLGDINGDGYADIGYAARYYYESALLDGMSRFNIIYGGSFTEQFLYIAGSGSYVATFGSMGDINNDGIDDFSIGYVDDINGMETSHINVYYGNSSMIYTPVMNLPMPLAMSSMFGTIGLGDMNNDGIDDFVTAPYNSIRLYYGGNVNPELWNLTLTPQSIGNAYGKCFFPVDLNADGWQDLIGSSPDYGGSTGQGRVHTWLGGPNMNGTTDLVMGDPNHPTLDMHYGRSLAVGDFNADNLDEVFIGSPGAQGLTDKYVYHYNGNTQLHDITFNKDELGSIQNKTSLQAYPNPFSDKLRVSFIAEKAEEVEIGVYNIKGQLVKGFDSFNAKAGSNIMEWDGTDKNYQKVAPGLYVIRLRTSATAVSVKCLKLQ